MDWMVLILIGLIAGTFGSLVGLGGGIIIVPSLLFVSSLGILNYPLTHQNAVGISLMVIIFNAVSSTLYNYKHKTVDIKSGLFFFAASGPATIIGSIFNKYINVKEFYILFGLLMLFITYLLTKQKKLKHKKVNWNITKEYIDGEGNHYVYGYNKVVGFIITGIAGLLGGLFGIGGGSILVPMMVLLFSFPPHVATATSMFIILLSSSLGTVSHILLGNIIFSYVLLLGFGAYIGGKIGSYTAGKMSSNTLLVTLKIVILLVAVQMIYKGL